MRPSFKIAALGIAIAGLLPAHRLDEVLQATLISIFPEHITLEIQIAPGVETVERFLRMADPSGQELVSEAAQKFYTQRLAADLRLEVDGQPTPLEVVQRAFPAVIDMRSGLGAIRLKLRAKFIPRGARLHRLYLRNNHAPAMSVYQANALVPQPGLEIMGQSRDPGQREITIRYETGEPRTARQWPLLAGLGLLAMLGMVAGRRRAGQPD